MPDSLNRLRAKLDETLRTRIKIAGRGYDRLGRAQAQAEKEEQVIPTRLAESRSERCNESQIVAGVFTESHSRAC